MTLTVTPVVHAEGDFDLDPDVTRALWHMEERHFWTRARSAWIADALVGERVAAGARILDVGCGSGAVAGALARRGYRVTGVDTAEPLVRKADQRFPAIDFYVAEVARLPDEVRDFDAVGLFDVLEHLDRPAELLCAAIARARPGAVVLATVPARRSLHSAVDDASGHKRRYEQGELAALMASVGLDEVRERGIFRWTEPIQRLARARYRGEVASRDQQRRALIASLRVPARPVNALLGALCRVERQLAFARAVGRPGPTLLASGRLREPS